MLIEKFKTEYYSIEIFRIDNRFKIDFMDLNMFTKDTVTMNTYREVTEFLNKISSNNVIRMSSYKRKTDSAEEKDAKFYKFLNSYRVKERDEKKEKQRKLDNIRVLRDYRIK